MSDTRRLDIAMYTEGLPFTGDTLEQRSLGGSETAFISVARELVRLGHRVTAYCHCEREGRFDDVEYRDLSRADGLGRREHDVFLCSRYFGVFSRSLRARVRFLWMHDVLVPQVAEGLRHVAPQLDLVYCVSEYHRGLTLQTLPELGARLATTFNGVDLDLIDDVRARVPEKRHKVMFTSRPERGLARALDHYERIGDRSLELLVCSYSSLEDPHVAQVEAACRSRMDGLSARGYPVSTGSFTKAELYRHLTESKAVLYPTDFPEVFCISAVEAQACGTAFLTTDAFALRETVGYERTPLGDDDAFQRRALEVLADDSLRRSLEERGRRHAERYTWRAVAETFVADAVRRLDRAPLEPVAFVDRVGPRPTLSDLSSHPGRVAATREAKLRIDRAERVARAWVDGVSVRSAAERAGGRSNGSGAEGPDDVRPGGRPRISCLTVTRCDRLALLKRSIRCFCDQTYPNRELVIVTEAGGRPLAAVRRYVDALDRDDIRVVPLPPGEYTLGKVRNASLAAAEGDVVCQWDDDDLFHPDRLMLQAAALLERGEGCAFLTDQLQFFEPDRSLHWVDWSAGGRVGDIWELIPGSLMMFADPRFRYPEAGDRAIRGEDSSMLEAMYGRTPFTRVAGIGWTTVYTYHGGNTFSAEHHLGQRDRSAPRAFIEARLAELSAALRRYPLPRPTTVHSREGPMFVAGV